jgi:hypothetical protein
MWQSKHFPAPTVHSVPGEYPLLLPVGDSNRGISGVLALLTFSRDGPWEAVSGGIRDERFTLVRGEVIQGVGPCRR